MKVGFQNVLAELSHSKIPYLVFYKMKYRNTLLAQPHTWYFVLGTLYFIQFPSHYSGKAR
jgi:hypothetical protein